MNTSTKRGSKFPRRLLLSLLFSTILLSLLTWLAYAEGSRSLYPASIDPDAHRANLEWRDSFYGDNFLKRRTLLQLYLEPDEVALMGSSAVDVGDGDILVYRSDQVDDDSVGNEQFPSAPVFTCSDQRTQFPGSPDLGQIESRDQELAGPATVDPATGLADPAGQAGYVPCFFRPQDLDPSVISSNNIYYVVFHGPAGGNSDDENAPTGEIGLNNGANFNTQQATSVAAWDVTVRDDFASTDITGRLFAKYLALFTGDNPRPMYSTLYILTIDGYIYRVDLNGLDPNGFMVYANDVGFLTSDGSPLLGDLVASTNQLNDPQGGVSLSPPLHLLFFEYPSDDAITANGITLDPPSPEITSFTFNGSISTNNTAFRAGGEFVFNSNIDGIYQLIISNDGVDFDWRKSTNRVLTGRHIAGEQTILWDGLDNAGNPFPLGLNYQARLEVHSGEYHFPLLDIENSEEGGPRYTLVKYPGYPDPDQCPRFFDGDPNCNIAFYDDRGYTTPDGDVGTPGVVLDGTDPPREAWSGSSGFDTRTDQRAFGNGSQSGFGDKKGLDLWTYFPSEARTALINIFGPDLAIQKTDHDISTAPGGVITYTLAYTNISTFPITATGVVITETVPANTIFNAGASTAGWSCADGSPAGTPCVFNVGELPANNSGTVIFAVTVDDPLDPAVSEILNGAIISDDRSQGDDPTPDNNTTEERTPVNHPPDLQIIKTDGGITSGPGLPIVYTLTYTNIGPVQATGVVITEEVPADTTFNAGASTPGWSCADGSPATTICTFSLGTLQVNVPGSVLFAVTVVSPLPPGVNEILNTTSISDDGSQGPDPTPQNNTSQEQTPVVSQLGPDLQIIKTDGGIISGPGLPIVYTLTYTNIGPVEATGVVITEEVPANTTFNAGASTPGWSCADSSPATTICTFSLANPLPVGGNGSVSFAVTVVSPLPPGVTEILNATSISDDGSQGPDPTPGNNTSQEQTPVVSQLSPDLQISKTDGGIISGPGGLIVYTLNYTNLGPVQATGVVITEEVPANATFNAGASEPGWSCADGSPAGTTCTLSLGTLQVNVPGSVLFAVRVDAPLDPAVTEILNATSISDDGSQGPDPTPDNNTSQEQTPVERIVTPVISKISDRSQARPGDVVNFTITASLATPPSNVNASNVIIVDALPKELELVNYSVSSLLPGLGYTSQVTTATISTAEHPSGIQQTTVATITVNVPVFSVDDRVTILVQARVNGLASPAPFNITNLAVLDYDEGDPRTSSVVVNVPPPSSSGGGGGDDDDDDDDDDTPPATTASAAPAPAPAAQPTPGLPVLFLPETGQKGVTPAEKANGTGLGVIWLVVLGSGIAGYFWWQTGKTRRKS